MVVTSIFYFYYLLVTNILLVGSKNVEPLITYEGPFMIEVPLNSVQVIKDCKGQLWIFKNLTLL
jgi:hypothetical protein